MKRIALFLLSVSIFSGVAHAGGYSEFYVKRTKTVVVDAAVFALRKSAFEAARNADLGKLRATLADSVTIYSAKDDPENMENDRFKIIGKIAGDKVLGRIAQQVVSAGEVSQKQIMRSGFFAIARLLRDPAIGPNGKMDGALCNRPVGVPDRKKFDAARAATKSRVAAWVVVKQDMGPSNTAETPGQYPTKLYQDQMVLRTTESHSDKRWTSIAALDGGESLYYQNPQSYSIAPYFADYVAQHVCFGKQNGKWKITSFALRVQ